MVRRSVALRCAAVLAFLLLFHIAVVKDRPLFVALACFAAAVLYWIGQWRGGNSGVYGWVYAVAGVVAGLSNNVADLAALAPALGYLMAMIVFARTLMPGKEPLITMYCRLAFGYMPDECVAYTRRLTVLWTFLLGGFALANIAMVLLAQVNTWLVAWSAVSIATMAAVFVGEHVLRRILYPHLPPSSLLRTGRVMLRAHFGG
jgi:uncharacterized membrane protein